jgi:MEMO1 family protein
MQDLLSAMEIGKGLAKVLADRNAVVISSSDFTHYEPQASVNKKDFATLKAIENLDVNSFIQRLKNKM